MRQRSSMATAVRRLALIAAMAQGLGLAGAAVAADAGVDPEADRILRGMSAYLGGLSSFSVEADIDDEVIDLAGQKLQFSSAGTLVVERPGHLHARRQGPLADIELIFDGQTLTVHGKRENVFAQIAVPGTADNALAELRLETGLDAPAGDLFAADPYAALMTEVTSGTYRGTAYVQGTECHHLAFRAAQVDWQLWVQTGDQPLPLKYVITSKWITGAPQYTVRLRNWDTAPTLQTDQFSFAAPEGARKLQRLSADHLGGLLIEEQQ